MHLDLCHFIRKCSSHIRFFIKAAGLLTGQWLNTTDSSNICKFSINSNRTNYNNNCSLWLVHSKDSKGQQYRYQKNTRPWMTFWWVFFSSDNFKANLTVNQRLIMPWIIISIPMGGHSLHSWILIQSLNIQWSHSKFYLQQQQPKKWLKIQEWSRIYLSCLSYKQGYVIYIVMVNQFVYLLPTVHFLFVCLFVIFIFKVQLDEP